METLMDRGQQFRAELEAIKANNLPRDFTWYGYDILANLGFIDELTRRSSDLLEEVSGGVVADIGAADGDLAFFLERQGFEVDIVDYGPTNWNGLRGARHMRELLGSSVAIHDVNLDEQFRLPRDRYDLVLFLGILYHVKNPFYILESLAQRSRFMLLSTRVARLTPAAVAIHGEPLAYLLDPDECNNDATNYWIFSEKGLTRLLDRCGWNIRAMMTVGDTELSNPRDSDHDERAFVSLESRRF